MGNVNVNFSAIPEAGLTGNSVNPVQKVLTATKVLSIVKEISSTSSAEVLWDNGGTEGPPTTWDHAIVTVETSGATVRMLVREDGGSNAVVFQINDKLPFCFPSQAAGAVITATADVIDLIQIETDDMTNVLVRITFYQTGTDDVD